MRSSVLAIAIVALSLFGARVNAQGIGIYGNGQLSLSGGTQDRVRDYSADAGLDLVLVINGEAMYSPFRSQSTRPQFQRIPGASIAFAATAVTTHPSGEIKRDRHGRVQVDKKTKEPISNIDIVSAGIYGMSKSIPLYDPATKNLCKSIELSQLPNGPYNLILKVSLPMTRAERTTYIPGATELSSWLGIFPNAFTKVKNENGIIVVEQPFGVGTYDGPDIQYVLSDPLNYWMLGYNSGLHSGWNINGVPGSFAGAGNQFVAAPHTVEEATRLYNAAMEEYGPYKDRLARLDAERKRKEEEEAERRRKNHQVDNNPLLVVTAGDDEKTGNPVWELTAMKDVRLIILNRKGKETLTELLANSTTTVSKSFIGYIVTVKATGERKFYFADGTQTTEPELRARIDR